MAGALLVAAAAALLLLAWALSRFAAFYVAFRRMELAIPGPPSLPVLGQALLMVGVNEDTMWKRMTAVWNNSYDLFRFGALFVLVVAASDPDHIEAMLRKKEAQNKSRLFYDFIKFFARESLVPLNGSKWRAHRKALRPAFHREVLERFVDVISEECRGFCERAQPGVPQDVTHNLTRTLAGSLLRTALVSEVSPEQEAAIGDVMRFMDVFFPSIMRRTFTPWLWPEWAYGLTRAARESKRLKAHVDRFSQSVIDRRRAQLRQQRLQQAQDGGGGGAADFIRQRPTLLDIMLDVDEPLSDGEILDEINMFAGAAIETTVAALGWTLKALSLRPDVQERVAQEVADVVGEDDALDAHHLHRLQYTECVIKETMRLRPPVLFVARETSAPTELCGYAVPAGTTFIVHIHGAHRDPRHWPDPLRFDPDRFLPENSRGRHPYAFIPFSSGPRNCIGMRQAMMTIKTFLATLAPRFRVDPVDDGHTDIASLPVRLSLAAYMQGGFNVVLTPREGALRGRAPTPASSTNSATSSSSSSTSSSTIPAASSSSSSFSPSCSSSPSTSSSTTPSSSSPSSSLSSSSSSSSMVC